MTASADESLVSSDVIWLCTSVPVSLTATTAKEALENDKRLNDNITVSVYKLCRVLEFWFSGIHFSEMGVFVTQASGIAMAAFISVITANLCMKDIEKEALQSFASTPDVFVRYVDGLPLHP